MCHNFIKEKQFTLTQSIIDPDGRFIIITASINHTTYTLTNKYGQKNNAPVFFHSFFSLLSYSNNLITTGNFNTVINPAIDGSKDNGLRGRKRDPCLKECSYLSTIHQCSSRIDLFISDSPNFH